MPEERTVQGRSQRSIRRPVEASGIGFFTGADVTIRLLPAPANHGIAFQRTDCPGSSPIPALIGNTVPCPRRTAIAHQGVQVSMIEHVMAVLAGLQIDNCLVQLNAPEPPGFDGSCRELADLLLEAGFEEQGERRPICSVDREVRVSGQDSDSEIAAKPTTRAGLVIGYQLDYGPHSPIPLQNLVVEITPESFLRELVFARTFVLQAEVDALRAQGYGLRTTPKDLIVYGPEGVVDNELRTIDECARHKILDCVGDFALLGADIHGFFSAYRSGHRLNQEVIRRLQAVQAEQGGGFASAVRRRAA